LVGERITLADIVVAAHLKALYELVLDPGFRKPFPNTNRWFLTLVNQPNFKSVFGEVQLSDKMKVAAAPAKGLGGGKKDLLFSNNLF
jgi:elongation factor 1-gamma